MIWVWTFHNSIYVYIYIYISVCVCVYMYMSMRMSLYVCVCVCVCVYVYVCVYIYIYICSYSWLLITFLLKWAEHSPSNAIYCTRKLRSAICVILVGYIWGLRIWRHRPLPTPFVSRITAPVKFHWDYITIACVQMRPIAFSMHNGSITAKA